MKRTLKLLFFIVMISVFMLLLMTLKVNAESTNIYLSETELTVSLNSIRFLTCKNTNGEKVVWASSNSNVATVDDGVVTGVGVGATKITATVGEQTATCDVTVVYADLTIMTNEGDYLSSTNLVMKEHPTEKLTVKIRDGRYEEVNDATVTWKSSNTNVVTVDNTGKITAVNVGTATITAEVAGVSDTCEVKVIAAPEFTDFSNAKYELLFDTATDLKISGIVPKDNIKNTYYYVITSDNTKPAIPINKNGSIDSLSESVEYFIVNTDENYIYDINIDKYVEID